MNGLGVTESQIQTQGADEISIALPGVTDADQALSVIGKTAQLEFFKDDAESRPVGPVESKEAALTELRSQGVSEGEIEQLRAESTSADYSLVERPADELNDIPGQWYVYARPPAMTGEAIKSARAGFDNRPAARTWSSSSRARAARPSRRSPESSIARACLKNEPQTFAIVLDSVMESDPMIDYTDPTLRDGIAGGSAEISGGGMTVQESKDLAFVLNTGALPVKLETAYRAAGVRDARQGLPGPGAHRRPRRPRSWSSSTCSSSTASSGWSPTSRSSSTASCSGASSTSSRSR